MRLSEIHQKGEDGVYRNADSVELIIGDSKRQICLADGNALLDARSYPGLCTQKFNADLITEGLDYASLTAGRRLALGGAVLEISAAGKRCYDECLLHQAGKTCPLPQNCAFASVVSGGIVHAGMDLQFRQNNDEISPDKEKTVDKLTHVDEKGRARMVDVGDKPDTKRRAVAQAVVTMKPETLRLICSGKMPKGDVFACARIAGIMAAKRTHELIPMCHPLPLDSVTVELTALEPDRVRIEATVSCFWHTGVEMEALTACSVAALTVYDMCKAVDRGMEIGSVMLLEKSGGKSGTYTRN